MSQEIGRILDSHFSRVRYNQKKNALKAKTNTLLKSIKKKEEEDVVDPFKGVKKVSFVQSPDKEFVEVKTEQKEFVPLHHIEPIPDNNEFQKKEKELQEKLNIIAEQKERLSRNVRAIEHRETDLRVIGVKLKKKADDLKQLQESLKQKQQSRRLEEIESAILTAKEESLDDESFRKTQIEDEILKVEERLKELKKTELNELTKRQIFTKNQIAEFVDYVKNLIALEEYKKALQFHEIASSMFLSTRLSPQDEERIKEILKEQYRRIKIEMMQQD